MVSLINTPGNGNNAIRPAIGPSASSSNLLNLGVGIIPGLAPVNAVSNLATAINSQFISQQQLNLIAQLLLENQLRTKNQPFDEQKSALKNNPNPKPNADQISKAEQELKKGNLKVEGFNSEVGGRDKVIKTLARAFGGNTELINKIANSGLSITLTDGAAGLTTRFGGAAAAFYESGGHSIKIGSGSSIGTLVHEVAHSLDAEDGNLDGCISGQNSVNQSIRNIADRVKSSGDYSLAGNSNELHYGFSDGDKAEQLAEAFRLAYEHPKEFKERFGKDAETIISFLKKDAWKNLGANKESQSQSSQNKSASDQSKNFLAMKNMMDFMKMMNLMNMQSAMQGQFMAGSPAALMMPSGIISPTRSGMLPAQGSFGLSIT